MNTFYLQIFGVTHGSRHRETRCRVFVGCSFRFAARALLYTPSQCGTETTSVRYSVRSWTDGSSDRFLMVKILRYFSFHSMLHKVSTKNQQQQNTHTLTHTHTYSKQERRYMYCTVCETLYIKDILLLFETSSVLTCGHRFPFLLR